jgi:hypothetical protein
MLDQGLGDGCHADVSHHLDGQRRAQHRAGIGTGEIECQQAQGHGCEARAQQRDDLREEEPSVHPDRKNVEHRLLPWLDAVTVADERPVVRQSP